MFQEGKRLSKRTYLFYINIEVASSNTYLIISIAWDGFDYDIEEYYGVK